MTDMKEWWAGQPFLYPGTADSLAKALIRSKTCSWSELKPEINADDMFVPVFNRFFLVCSFCSLKYLDDSGLFGRLLVLPTRKHAR